MSNNILNPLEKEMLVRLYKNNPSVKLADFCAANNVSSAAFKTWLKKYEAEGLTGLYRSKKTPSVLPDGVDETEENLRRELIKTRIENERLKKATPGSRTAMGLRVGSCLYTTRIRDHRGALPRFRCENPLRVMRRKPQRVLQVEEKRRRAARRQKAPVQSGAGVPRGALGPRLPLDSRLSR